MHFMAEFSTWLAGISPEVILIKKFIIMRIEEMIKKDKISNEDDLREQITELTKRTGNALYKKEKIDELFEMLTGKLSQDPPPSPPPPQSPPPQQSPSSAPLAPSSPAPLSPHHRSRPHHRHRPPHRSRLARQKSP